MTEKIVARTKKQHVVPRFYLSKFCDPDGLVWTYSSKNKPRGDKPEATAIEKNFYSPINESGERFDEAEKVLGIIEGSAAPLWERLCEGKVFKGEEREHIAFFLAAQYLRSPSAVGAGAEMVASFVHHTAKFIAVNEEAHEHSVNLYELETGKKVSRDERRKMRQFISDPNNFSISILQSTGLLVLSGIESVADTFIKMNWVVGCSEDQHLITSDSPVTKISDPATYHPILGDGGFANNTVRVNFPLTPTRIIEMSWKGEERGRVAKVPKTMAREINRLRAMQAERFVYASRSDNGITRLCDKWLGRARPPKIVTGEAAPSIKVKRKL